MCSIGGRNEFGQHFEWILHSRIAEEEREDGFERISHFLIKRCRRPKTEVLGSPYGPPLERRSI